VSPLFALLSAVLVGGADFIGGLASRRAWPVRVAAWAQGIGFLVSLPIAAVVGADRLTGPDVAWSVGSGAAVGVGLALFYTSMALGQISIAAPAAAVAGALLPVGIGLARGERPGPAGLAGIAAALVAIGVVSFAPGHPTAKDTAPTALLLALLAGACFGVFYVSLSQVGDSAGLWPVSLSRAASSGLLGLVVLTRGRRRPTARGVRVLTAWVGVLEVAAVTALVIAFRHGTLAIASVLASLYPVTTVLLARVVLHERLTRLQLAAVALALGAVVLVSTA
jgi:drug/metabolite transporter (DMT)-like permease